MVIKPTVGRVVWFYQDGRKQDDQPRAAIVTHVWSDSIVNLAIFEPSGAPMIHPPTSVTLLQEGDPVPNIGYYCTWMPYQVGQAKKHAETPAS